VFIRHPELNSRNPTILPLKHHQKPCRTPYKVQQLGLTTAKSPSGGHVPLGATASRPPGGGHVPPGAKRLKIDFKFCINRLAKTPTSPGGRDPISLLLVLYRLAGPPSPPGATCIRPHYCLDIAWRPNPHR